jgi:hypothetical protein
MSDDRQDSQPLSGLASGADLGSLPVPVPRAAALPATASAPTPASGPQGSSAYLRTLTGETHNYVSQYIAVADQKAVFIAATAAALLAFLYQSGAGAQWLKEPKTWSVVSVVALVAMATLSVATVWAVWVVKPRLLHGGQDPVSFPGIALYPSPKEYLEDLLVQSDDDLMVQKLQHTHALATICRSKHQALARIVVIETVGFAASALYFLLSKPAGGAP